MTWFVLSFVLWGLDWWTTAHAIANGAIEANPIAAHFHTIIGIHWYALALIPIIAARAYVAASSDTSFVWLVARAAARAFILVHILVVLNNFVVIATL